MGSRHNRKRTRSRPRNRRRSSSSLPADPVSFDAAPYPAPYSYTHFPDRTSYEPVSYDTGYGPRIVSPWHDDAPTVVDAHCVLLFGGHPGEERSLCAPMLQVVMGLFNGDIDYDDP